jgi:hypothetical protein
VDVASEVFAPRLQVAYQRRAIEDDGNVVHIECDTGLIGDSGDVQDGIGGAAGRGHHGAGILERLSGDNIAWEGGATQHGFGNDAAGATHHI